MGRQTPSNILYGMKAWNEAGNGHVRSDSLKMKRQVALQRAISTGSRSNMGLNSMGEHDD